MIMWITALVLVTVCAILGYRAGATRALFAFIGIIIAACCAVPLTPAFAWIFPIIGFKNELVGAFGGPIIAFVVVSLFVQGIGQFVHRKIDYHFRYNRQDAERAVWEVMHRRVGATIGVMNGTAYFVVFSIIIAVFGYYTIQTGAGENSSKFFSMIGKSAEDLQATKMDKVVAPFNPAPERYFDGSDIAGLLYNNRNLADRLYNYPPFASMAEEPVFKELGKDREVQALVKGNASLNEIMDNLKVGEVISNTPLVQTVKDMDFKDLNKYLETGVSEKYGQQKLLGHWGYDENATLQLNKKLKPEVGAAAWFRIKNEVTERFDNAVFTAFHDNKAKLVLATNMDGKASPLRAIPPPATAPRGTPTNYVALWANTNALYSATGKWSESGPNYLISLGSPKSGTITSEAKLDGDRLTFQFGGGALAFRKMPD